MHTTLDQNWNTAETRLNSLLVQGSEEGPKYAVQIYSKGQMCDLTGKERQVDARFVCSEDPIHIRAIEEIVSCQYVIVIGTPVICSEDLGTVPGGRQKVWFWPFGLFLCHPSVCNSAGM